MGLKSLFVLSVIVIGSANLFPTDNLQEFLSTLSVGQRFEANGLYYVVTKTSSSAMGYAAYNGASNLRLPKFEGRMFLGAKLDAYKSTPSSVYRSSFNSDIVHRDGPTNKQYSQIYETTEDYQNVKNNRNINQHDEITDTSHGNKNLRYNLQQIQAQSQINSGSYANGYQNQFQSQGNPGSYQNQAQTQNSEGGNQQQNQESRPVNENKRFSSTTPPQSNFYKSNETNRTVNKNPLYSIQTHQTQKLNSENMQQVITRKQQSSHMGTLVHVSDEMPIYSPNEKVSVVIEYPTERYSSDDEITTRKPLKRPTITRRNPTKNPNDSSATYSSLADEDVK